MWRYLVRYRHIGRATRWDTDGGMTLGRKRSVSPFSLFRTWCVITSDYSLELIPLACTLSLRACVVRSVAHQRVGACMRRARPRVRARVGGHFGVMIYPKRKPLVRVLFTYDHSINAVGTCMLLDCTGTLDVFEHYLYTIYS